MSFDQNQPMPPLAPQKSGMSTGKGCLLGCVVMCAVFVILVIAAGAYFYSFATSMIDQYTDTEKIALPAVEYDADEAAAVEARFTDFFENADAAEETQTLELTDHEINVLLRSRPEAEIFGDDWIYVDIDGDQLNGEISMPLAEFGFVGRYINASVGLKASVVNDELFVTIESANVKGTPLPEEFMQQFRGQNLAQEAASDPEMEQYVNRVQEIVIEDDKLKLVLKPKS